MSKEKSSHEWWLDLIMGIVCGYVLYLVIDQHGFGQVDANSFRTKNTVGFIKIIDKYVDYRITAVVLTLFSLGLFYSAYSKFKKKVS